MAVNSIGELIIEIAGDWSQLEKDLQRATQAASDAGKGIADALSTNAGALTGLGATLTAALTVPIMGAAAAALDAANQFDEAFDHIRAATGQTGQALEQLQESFRNVFTNVPATMADVSTAMASLAQRTGLTGEALEKLATQELNLAHVTGSQVGPLIEATTRMFGDWGIATEQQAEKLDFLFKTTQQTGIGITNLTQLVVQFGAPLRQLGFDFEHAAVMLAEWEKSGVNVQTVLSGLRYAVGQFSKAGLDSSEALRQVISDIKNMDDETKAVTESVTVFGRRAAVDMFRAIKEGHLDIDALTNSIKASTETINKASEETRSFGEKWQLFKNQVQAALEPLGVPLTQALQKLFDAMAPLLEVVRQFAEWIASLPTPVLAAGVAVAGLAAAVGPLVVALGGLGFAVSGIQQGIPAVIGLMEALGLKSAAAAVQMETASVAAGGAKAAFTGLAGIIGVGLVSAITGAALAFMELNDSMDRAAKNSFGKSVSEMDASFKVWIADIVSAATAMENLDVIAEAQSKINQALEAGAISAAEAAKYTQQLDAANKQLISTNAKGYMESSGLAIDATALKTQGAAKSTGQFVDVMGALGKETKQTEDHFKSWGQVITHSADSIEILKERIRLAEAEHQKWIKTQAAGLIIDKEVAEQVKRSAAAFDELTNNIPRAVSPMNAFGQATKGTTDLLEDFRQAGLDAQKLNFDPVADAMRRLGLDAEGTKKKTAELVAAFNDLAGQGGVSLGQISAGFQQLEPAIRKAGQEFSSLKDLVTSDIWDAYNRGLDLLQAKGASANEILAAQRVGLEALIAAAKKSGESVGDFVFKLEKIKLAQELNAESATQMSQAQIIALSNMTLAAEAHRDAVNFMSDGYKMLQRSFVDAFEALGKGFADAILSGKNFGEVMQSVIDKLVRQILDDLIGNAFKLLGKTIWSVVEGGTADIGRLSKSLDGLAKQVVSLFGPAAKTPTEAAAGATGAATSAATGGAPTAGGVGAGGGAMGTIGAIGSIVDAISGIIGNFQMAGMNKSLDLVVQHTLRIFNVLDQWHEQWFEHDGMMFTRLGEILTSIREQTALLYQAITELQNNLLARLGDIWGTLQQIADSAGIDTTVQAQSTQALAAAQSTQVATEQVAVTSADSLGQLGDIASISEMARDENASGFAMATDAIRLTHQRLTDLFGASAAMQRATDQVAVGNAAINDSVTASVQQLGLVFGAAQGTTANTGTIAGSTAAINTGIISMGATARETASTATAIRSTAKDISDTADSIVGVLNQIVSALVDICTQLDQIIRGLSDLNVGMADILATLRESGSSVAQSLASIASFFQSLSNALDAIGKTLTAIESNTKSIMANTAKPGGTATGTTGTTMPPLGTIIPPLGTVVPPIGSVIPSIHAAVSPVAPALVPPNLSPGSVNNSTTSSSFGNITFNINGAQSPLQTARAIFDTLKHMSPAFSAAATATPGS